MSITDFQSEGFFQKNILIILCNITALVIVVSGLLIISYLLKTNKRKITREKLRAFECGFDPEHKMRRSFSLRFFIITVVFLIFDVEVAAILPIPLINNTLRYRDFFISNLRLFIILIGGLIFE